MWREIHLGERMTKLVVTSAIPIIVLTIVLIMPLASAQITTPSPFRTSGNNPFVNLTPYLGGGNTAASTTVAPPPRSLGPFSQLCTTFGQCSVGGGNTGAQATSSSPVGGSSGCFSGNSIGANGLCASNTLAQQQQQPLQTQQSPYNYQQQPPTAQFNQPAQQQPPTAQFNQPAQQQFQSGPYGNHTNPGNLTTALSMEQSNNCRPGDTLVGNICYPAANNSATTPNCNLVNETKTSLCHIQQSTYQSNNGSSPNIINNSFLSAADIADADSMALAIDTPLVKEYGLWPAGLPIQNLIN